MFNLIHNHMYQLCKTTNKARLRSPDYSSLSIRSKLCLQSKVLPWKRSSHLHYNKQDPIEIKHGLKVALSTATKTSIQLVAHYN